MSSVVISGNTSGAITLSAPDVSGTNTATLPAATGTVMVSGNMPAFSAYLGSTQTISANTYTKVQINTEEYDTNNCFDSTTNYRFTPTVAGYYQVTGSSSIDATVTNPTFGYGAIYKNGSVYKRTSYTGNTSTLLTTLVTSLIYFNGTTDYVELYVYAGNATGPVLNGAVSLTYFCASLIRTA